MYYILSIVSWIIRTFFTPNPFNAFFDNKYTADGVNFLLGGIFIPLAYYLTNALYDSGEPAIGSVIFFIMYLILTFIMIIISWFIKNLLIAIFIFVVIYFAMIVGLRIFRDRYL